MTYKRGNIGEVCHFYTYNSLARPLVRIAGRNTQSVNDTFDYNSLAELMNATGNGALHMYDYDNIGNTPTLSKTASAWQVAQNTSSMS